MPQEILPTDENLSERQLRWGKWWLEHKHQVKTGYTIALAVLAFSLVAYAGWGFLDWFFGSGVRERAQIALLTKDLTDYAGFREATAPVQIQVEPATTVPAGPGKYDLVARVANQNEDWWVEFDYVFSGPGADGSVRRGYLLPAEEKYLRSLAVKSESRPSPSIEIKNLVWHRVDKHVVRPDYRSWAGARLNIVISDAGFFPPSPDDTIPVSKAKFVVTNNTGFSYHAVTFFVVLQSGGRIVGVNQVVASDLRAGERRQMEAGWFNDLPNITRVEITPEINIFDDRVYVPPEG